MAFCHLQKKKNGSKCGKKLVNSAKKIGKSKYGKALKKEGLKFVKTSGKKNKDCRIFW